MPLPKNTADVFSRHKKIIVCELNNGQFVNYLRMKHPDFKYHQYCKVLSQPFSMDELTSKFNELLKEE
jgi:2-oxoglutarate ferredoxin oxidoreductase subunit alpha